MAPEYPNPLTPQNLRNSVDQRCRLTNKTCPVILRASIEIPDLAISNDIDPHFLPAAFAEQMSVCDGAALEISNECGSRGEEVLQCRHPTNDAQEVARETIRLAFLAMKQHQSVERHRRAHGEV